MYIVSKEDEIKLDEILTQLGLYKAFTSARVIAVKPNFASGTYIASDSHVVTNIDRISDFIKQALIINPSAKVLICESDSTGNGFAYEKFNHFNLPDAFKLSADQLEHVELVDLTRDRLEEISDESFKYFRGEFKKLYLSKKFIEADFKVSFANLKTHSVANYTGACKNLFGCLPDFEKSHFHPYIHYVIHDLVKGINPDLSIVDGFYAMEQNGPCNGFATDFGFSVYSDSAVSADLCASYMTGFKVDDIKYLKILYDNHSDDYISIMNLTQIRRAVRPQIFLRVMNSIGVTIQRVGQGIANFGHRIHTCNSPLILVTTIFRPLLVKMFGLEKLREMKRRVIK